MSIESPFYPGSRQRRDDPRLHQISEVVDDPFLTVLPRKYTVKGKEMEFFTIGQLAAALGREPVTLRSWERKGILPRATFQAPNPKKDFRARRRLYSRAQAEGIYRIAVEEGLFDTRTQISKTQFTARVTELFRGLM